ncbi:MAG: LCP family protein [Firmicutes bacterium]|nr:LCP family protein [Bacillota bacterium]
MAKPKKRSGGATAAIVILSVLLCFVIIALAGMGYVYFRLNGIKDIDRIFPSNSGKKVEEFEKDPVVDNESAVYVDPDDISWPDVKTEENVDESWVYDDPDVINIMLIGIDTASYVGRSDTMMLISMNKSTKEITMSSFMRDLYVQIADGYSANKLNAAYAFGGADLMDKTYLLNFGVKIDGHVLVDFESFPAVIDALGGVDIALTDAEAWEIGYSGSGTYHLDGSDALKYARIRKIDSDFSRTSRQRTVMNAIFEKYHGMSSVELLSMANKILDLVYTDMDAARILSIGSEFMGVQSIRQLRFPGNDEYYDAVINGMMVLVPDLEMIHERIGSEIYGID